MTQRFVSRRLLLLSYLVALVPAFVFFNLYNFAPRDEAAVYWRLGNQWAGKGSYTSLARPDEPEGFWPVGYPSFVCGVVKVFGSKPRMVVVANLLLYTIMIALSGRIGYLAYGEKVACATMLLTGSIYEIFTLPSVTLPENLFIPLLLGTIALIMDDKSAYRLGRWGLAGLLLGFAVLTLGAVLVMPLFLLAPVALWVWWPWSRRQKVLLHLLVLAGGLCVPVGLWAKRNYAQFHVFAPESFKSGEELAFANNKFNTYWYLDPRDKRRRGIGLYGPDAERYQRAIALAVEDITTHKAGFVTKSFSRAYWAFAGTNPWWASRTVLQVPLAADLGIGVIYLETILLWQWLVFLLMAIQGARFGWQTAHPQRLLLMAVCCYYALFLATQPIHLRHRLPIIPVFAVFAAFYLMYVHQHLRQWRTETMEDASLQLATDAD